MRGVERVLLGRCYRLATFENQNALRIVYLKF